MDSGALTRENTTAADAGADDRAGRVRGGGGYVELGLADVEGLGPVELVKFLVQADAARRRLDGCLAALLGRLGDLEGDDAVAELCRQFGLGRHKARQQAKTAAALKALPRTLEAANGGFTTIEHARLMGESNQRAPMSEAQELELIELAMFQDCDQFKKTVALYEDQRSTDDGKSRLERQRERRTAKVFDGDHEMVVLHAELDRINGERVKTAMDALSDRMFRHDSKTESDRTWAQRNADALVALITQQPADNSGPDRAAESRPETQQTPGGDIAPQATTLVVTVEYDTLTRQLQNAALIDGTPIPTAELRRIACDAAIIPAIFSAEGQPLYLGRKQRTATAAQKLALQTRDKQCVNCGLRATACDTHHIQWWTHGGTTNIETTSPCSAPNATGRFTNGTATGLKTPKGDYSPGGRSAWAR